MWVEAQLLDGTVDGCLSKRSPLTCSRKDLWLRSNSQDFITFATGFKEGEDWTRRQEIKGHVNDWSGNVVQENIDTPFPVICQEGMCKELTASTALQPRQELKSRCGLASDKMKTGLLSASPLHEFRVPLHCQYLSSPQLPRAHGQALPTTMSVSRTELELLFQSKSSIIPSMPSKCPCCWSGKDGDK